MCDEVECIQIRGGKICRIHVVSHSTHIVLFAIRMVLGSFLDPKSVRSKYLDDLELVLHHRNFL